MQVGGVSTCSSSASYPASSSCPHRPHLQVHLDPHPHIREIQGFFSPTHFLSSASIDTKSVPFLHTGYVTYPKRTVRVLCCAGYVWDPCYSTLSGFFRRLLLDEPPNMITLKWVIQLSWE